MQLTYHANKRMRQRGFLRDHIDMLLKYGKSERKPGNVLEIKLSQKNRSQIIENLKKTIRLISKCRNKAILIDTSGEIIITAYHLY